MLSISEGTSKSQYARARQLLQQKLQREQKQGLPSSGMPPIRNESV